MVGWFLLGQRVRFICDPVCGSFEPFENSVNGYNLVCLYVYYEYMRGDLAFFSRYIVR